MRSFSNSSLDTIVSLKGFLVSFLVSESRKFCILTLLAFVVSFVPIMILFSILHRKRTKIRLVFQIICSINQQFHSRFPQVLKNQGDLLGGKSALVAAVARLLQGGAERFIESNP